MESPGHKKHESHESPMGKHNAWKEAFKNSLYAAAAAGAGWVILQTFFWPAIPIWMFAPMLGGALTTILSSKK